MLHTPTAALPHCAPVTPTPLHTPPCPPILILRVEVELGFCITNMFQQWFLGRRWQTSPKKSASHLSSLRKMVRVAWQYIRLYQKYWQFKFKLKGALSKENQFQFSIKVLGENERPRIYQKLPPWAEQWLVGLPSLLSDPESPITCKERPSGHFRMSTGFVPKISQEIEARPWREVIPWWRSYRDLNRQFILFLKSKKNFGSNKRISEAKHLRSGRYFGSICQVMLNYLLQIPSLALPINTVPGPPLEDSGSVGLRWGPGKLVVRNIWQQSSRSPGLCLHTSKDREFPPFKGDPSQLWRAMTIKNIWLWTENFLLYQVLQPSGLCTDAGKSNLSAASSQVGRWNLHTGMTASAYTEYQKRRHIWLFWEPLLHLSCVPSVLLPKGSDVNKNH